MTINRVRVDHISSSVNNADLSTEISIGSEVICKEGYILAVRVLNEKNTYHQIENPAGRLISLRAGNTLVGALGNRHALRGYSGHVPEKLGVGDTIQILNMGGVLGQCTSTHIDLGPPFQVEVLGAVLVFPSIHSRIGIPTSTYMNAISPSKKLNCTTPIVLVIGTNMDCGKTMAAIELIHGLTRTGLKVAGLKVTGISLQRDTLMMMDAGAIAALNFTDTGIISTNKTNVIPSTYGLLNKLAETYSPDVIVVELGDGIFGEYGVTSVLEDNNIKKITKAIICCAPDQVAAWGAVRILEDVFNLRATLISGPVTDNEVGTKFIETTLQLPAYNARLKNKGLTTTILETIS